MIFGDKSDAGVIAENLALPAQSCEVHQDIPIVRTKPSISILQKDGMPESINLTFNSGTIDNKLLKTRSLRLPQTLIFRLSSPV